MSEVLSQNQIDALLESIQGGDSTTNTKDKTEEKKYRKYDFYSPKKFTKDKLRLLRDVFEKYSRILVSQINSLFRVNCEIDIMSIEEQRYYEFGNALRDSDVLASIHVDLQDEKQVKPVLMYMTTPLMLSFMDRLMGGNGDSEEDDIDYSYTDIERSLYSMIMKYLSEGLKDAWENYIEILFEFYEIEDNPTMQQSIGLDETVVIVSLEVKAQEVQGRISICFAGDLLSDIFTVFDRKTNREKSTNYVDRSEDIMYNIRNSDLDVVVKLGELELRMEDLYNLHPGDVINLNKPKEADVEVSIADLPWFTGRLGQQNNKMAVLLNQTLTKEKDNKREVE